MKIKRILDWIWLFVFPIPPIYGFGWMIYDTINPLEFGVFYRKYAIFLISLYWLSIIVGIREKEL